MELSDTAQQSHHTNRGQKLDSIEVLDAKELAILLNDEFKKAVLPVTTFVGIEVVLGFFGNLLVLYVFLFRYHVCNFRYFVLCLAFIDITSSVTTMPGEMVTQLYWYIYPVREICKVKSFFNVFTVSAEAFCLLTIALDRYRKVCRPFGWQIKPRIAKYICGVIYVVAFIVALPVAFFWGIHSHEKTFRNANITVTVCEKDAEYEKTNYPLTYSVTVETLVGICLCLMFALYVFVTRKLLQDKRLESSNSSQAHVTPSSIELELDGVSSDVIEKSRAEISDTGYSSGVDNTSGHSKEELEDDMTSKEDPEEKQSHFGNTLHVPQVHHKRSHKTMHKLKTKQINVQKYNKEIARRVRRKTLIMLILTIAFIVTTILYLTLLSFIARSDDILQEMSDQGKAVYFFFFRLYFVNHVMNPIVYGALDLKFRKVMLSLIKK